MQAANKQTKLKNINFEKKLNIAQALAANLEIDALTREGLRPGGNCRGGKILFKLYFTAWSKIQCLLNDLTQEGLRPG